MTRHFLVIGAQRCGTTWLHDLLAAHPQIAMARPARPEPKVFLQSAAVDPEAYRAEFFAHARGESALGEKSTSYLESPEAPARVAASIGDAQIVVQLRDPVQRAVSNWKFSRDHGREDRPLTEALRSDLTDPSAWDRSQSSVSPFAYVTRGRYAEQLARWNDRFEVYVQFLEEVRADSSRIGVLYRWLGVDDVFGPDTDSATKNASAPSAERLDAGFVEELREYYADSDAALGALLGRDLPWPIRQSA